MKLSQSILNVRKSKNLSQEQMAETLYVTRQTISNWENNKSYPDLETLVLISDKFNISLDELLKEDKKAIKSLNKKIKMHKTLKIATLSLLIIMFVIGISFGISKFNDNAKNNKILEKLNELGFDKAKSGFLMLEEDGVGYHVYKSEKGKILYGELYAETRDISSRGIVITYTKSEATIYYFDEKVKVYCDSKGNIIKGKNTDEAIAVYNDYEVQTKKMIKRMTELFNELF